LWGKKSEKDFLPTHLALDGRRSGLQERDQGPRLKMLKDRMVFSLLEWLLPLAIN